MNPTTTATTRLVLDAAERIFADLATKEIVDRVESGLFPDALWQALAEGGFTRLTPPAVAGGSGLGLPALLPFLRLAGRFAVPLPLLEHEIALGLLAAAGEVLPEGLVGLGTASLAFAGDRVSGTAPAVAFGRHAEHLLLVDGEQARFALVPAGSTGVTVPSGATT